MRRLSIAVVVLLFLTTCNSRIDQTPAAEVSDHPGSSTAPATSTLQPTSVGQVIKEKSSIGFIGAKVTGEHVESSTSSTAGSSTSALSQLLSTSPSARPR